MFGPKLVSADVVDRWESDPHHLDIKVVQKYWGYCENLVERCFRSVVHSALFLEQLPTDIVIWNNGVYMRRTFRFCVNNHNNHNDQNDKRFEFDVMYHDKMNFDHHHVEAAAKVISNGYNHHHHHHHQSIDQPVQ